MKPIADFMRSEMDGELRAIINAEGLLKDRGGGI